MKENTPISNQTKSSSGIEMEQEEQTPFTDPLNNPFGSLNDLCYDLSSLQDLATRGSYKTILDKISLARQHSRLSKPHEHLTYLTYNVLSLAKLRRYSEALAELDSLDQDLSHPFYHYQSYPQHYPNLTGSMVPFALRWLHAQLPSRIGKPLETLDRFYVLLDFVRGKLSHNNKSSARWGEVWRKREGLVVNSIISHHLGNKEFEVSLALIQDLIHRSHDSDLEAKGVLFSKLGYIQMQYGDLEGAKATFAKIEDMLNQGKDQDRPLIQMMNLVSRNKAFMYLVGKDYVSAVREYDVCIERDGSDVVAINNKALCLMYLRDLSDSIKVLENALERVPTAALNETVVVNLCSMYELAYVNHTDIKRTLSNWIARVAPDDFDSSCTRI